MMRLTRAICCILIFSEVSYVAKCQDDHDDHDEDDDDEDHVDTEGFGSVICGDTRCLVSNHYCPLVKDPDNFTLYT